MKIKQNHNKKFSARYNDNQTGKTELPEALRLFLKDGFSVEDECIYFKALAPKGKHSAYFMDRTGNECFFNKIHIADYLLPEEEKENLEFGVLFSNELLKALNLFFKQKFHVILSCNGDDCVVRFHKERLSERWLSSDLEGYKFEAVLELFN